MSTIDLSNLIPLSQVPKLLPCSRPGCKVSLANVYRWVVSGALPAVKIGGRYFVHPDDLASMAQPVERPKAHEPARVMKAKRDREYQARQDRAMANLKRLGMA